jgi:hypothetical protein
MGKPPYTQTVLNILSTNSLFAKKEKCCFRVLQVDYLRHQISAQGVSVDPKKIQAVLDWSKPTTVKRMRGFLGLARYYCKFIHHFGEYQLL